MKHILLVSLACTSIVCNVMSMEISSDDSLTSLKKSFTQSWVKDIERLNLSTLNIYMSDLNAKLTTYKKLLKESAKAGVLLGNDAHIKISENKDDITSTCFPSEKKPLLLSEPVFIIFHGINQRDKKLIKLLLKHQITLKIKNNSDQDPLEYVQKKLNENIDQNNRKNIHSYINIKSLLQHHILKQTQSLLIEKP